MLMVRPELLRVHIQNKVRIVTYIKNKVRIVTHSKNKVNKTVMHTN